MIIDGNKKAEMYSKYFTNPFILEILKGNPPEILEDNCRIIPNERLNYLKPFINAHGYTILPLFCDQFSIYCINLQKDNDFYCRYILEEDKFETFGKTIQSIFLRFIFTLFDSGVFEDNELIELGKNLEIKNIESFISDLNSLELDYTELKEWLKLKCQNA